MVDKRNVNMKNWWCDNGRGKLTYLQENLYQRRFFQHKLHMNCCGIKARPLKWEEIIQSTVNFIKENPFIKKLQKFYRSNIEKNGKTHGIWSRNVQTNNRQQKPFHLEWEQKRTWKQLVYMDRTITLWIILAEWHQRWPALILQTATVWPSACKIKWILWLSAGGNVLDNALY
jgi:hypothetical protein